MNCKRLTREDSREDTRKHLLDAAQSLIAKEGLSTASIEDIAESAGYTRGAFYSNFSSKDDLFLELLRRDHEETHVQLTALLDDSLPLDHIYTRARQIYGQMYRDSESFMNWSEARMLAARNSKFRTKLNVLLTESFTPTTQPSPLSAYSSQIPGSILTDRSRCFRRGTLSGRFGRLLAESALARRLLTKENELVDYISTSNWPHKFAAAPQQAKEEERLLGLVHRSREPCASARGRHVLR